MGSLAHDLLLSGVFCKTCVALQSLVFLGVTLFFLGVHAACVDGGSAYWVTPQWVGGCWGGLWWLYPGAQGAKPPPPPAGGSAPRYNVIPASALALSGRVKRYTVKPASHL